MASLKACNGAQSLLFRILCSLRLALFSSTKLKKITQDEMDLAPLR